MARVENAAQALTLEKRPQRGGSEEAMSETATLRATSLLASTGILGGMVSVALTFTYVLPVMDNPFPSAPVVRAEPEPPPEPPPPEPLRRPVTMPTTNTEPMTTILPSEPGPMPIEIGEIGVPTPNLVPVITQPHWLRRPRDLQRYYPRTAMARSIEGDVVLDCVVGTTGNLRCSVVSETPETWGFADAARRIAAEHRMTPAMRDGAPVEGRYRMRVPFRIE
jgi:protein TonB